MITNIVNSGTVWFVSAIVMHPILHPKGASETTNNVDPDLTTLSAAADLGLRL